MRPASPSPLLSSPATDGTVANRLLPQPLPSKTPDNGVKEIAKTFNSPSDLFKYKPSLARATEAEQLSL